MKRRLALAILLLVLIAAILERGQLLAWGTALRLSFGQTGGNTPLLASGTIETETIDLSSQAGGRIIRLNVTEGDQVAAGDLIAELDTALVDAQIAQASATISQTQAQLALLKAGPPPASIEVARAGITQAQAASAAAYTAWQDAKALLTAPDSLDVQIINAQTTVQVAQEQVAAAHALATAADEEQALWGRIVAQLEKGYDIPSPQPGGGTVHVKAPAAQLSDAYLQWNLASQKAWQAHAQVDIATATLATARQTLSDLQAQKVTPQSQQAQANAAEWAYRAAEAAVDVARANLDVLLAGAQAEQLQSAQALVEQAEASLKALQVRRSQAQVRAPQAGTIIETILHRGEVAGPGSPIARLGDLSKVTLTVYLPESQLALVHLGQSAQVVVDSYPGRLFPGRVVEIADEAQFTPQNVQTREQRATTVYAVKISIANAGGDLKPGMPADAYLCTNGNSNCGAPSMPRAAATRSATGGAIRSAGTIEATKINVAAESAGRVIEVTAAEGNSVAAGQLLVRQDSSELEANRSQALAALTAAEADLAQLKAPTQAARVAQARSQVAQAETVLAGAQVALADAQQLRANPQDLDAQINNARAQLQTAAAEIELAQANLKQAQVLQDSIPADTGSDENRTRRAIYDRNVQAAQASLRAAQAQQQGAESALELLLAIRAKPVALDAAVHKAQGQVAQAQAALDVARAMLVQVQAPPQAEAIAAAEARVAQARALVAQLDVAIAKLQVASPVSGTVIARVINTGEVALPGATLLTIADLADVRMLVYVPEADIGRVKIGQKAQVTLDAYPGRTFEGMVRHINDKAEFTPKNVQTTEERAKTVFRVEIALDNPQQLIKPGMPGEAVLMPTP